MRKKNVVLGISGGIAAYKCADLTRRLIERGFDVRVVLTPGAESFITPMTLQAVSGHMVHTETFDPQMEAAMGHIELAKWADYILIAPATANIIAKLVQGAADNLLLTLVLASQAKRVIAPAMNQQMWADKATQSNIQSLIASQVSVLGPAEGEQACGDVGAGRMLEPDEIATLLHEMAFAPKPLQGKKLLLTAGPTIEPLDPVRFISNHSSGKMGYALAESAAQMGAEVTLVSGPVNLPVPPNVAVIQVSTAKQMLAEVQRHFSEVTIFIGCAAVADYAPLEVAQQKIKKDSDTLTLELTKNPDILAWVGEQAGDCFVVGFAAESQNIRENAQKKLQRKNLDMICANDISQTGIGFNSDDNELLLLFRNGSSQQLSFASKRELSRQILQNIAANLAAA